MSVFVSPEYIKAKEYANDKYAAELAAIDSDCDNKLRRATTIRNLQTVFSFFEQILTQRVKDMMQAKLDASLTGYENYDVEISDDLRNEIIMEVTGVREVGVRENNRIVNSIAGLRNTPQLVNRLAESFGRIAVPINDIRSQVEERRVKIKRDKEMRSLAVSIHNSTVANLNLGTQAGTISATVQSNPAVLDKRMEIFKCTRSLISSVVTNVHVEIPDMQKFHRETQDCKLFFGPEVEQYLDEVYRKGMELNTINFMTNNPSPHNPQQPDFGKRTEILHWFVQQQKRVTSVFQKYLDFTKP